MPARSPVAFETFAAFANGGDVGALASLEPRPDLLPPPNADVFVVPYPHPEFVTRTGLGSGSSSAAATNLRNWVSSGAPRTLNP